LVVFKFFAIGSFYNAISQNISRLPFSLLLSGLHPPFEVKPASFRQSTSRPTEQLMIRLLSYRPLQIAQPMQLLRLVKI
jgi:hypothetical protein